MSGSVIPFSAITGSAITSPRSGPSGASAGDGVALGELRIQEREILEAIRVGKRDTQPLRLCRGQRGSAWASSGPTGSPAASRPGGSCSTTLGLPVADTASPTRNIVRQGEGEGEAEPVRDELAVARDDVGVKSEVH